MHKKFIKFFEDRNFKIEGNYAYGEWRGFETSILVQTMDPVFPVKITMSLYCDDQTKLMLGEKIKALKIKFFTFGIAANGLFLGFNDMTINKLLARFDLEMERIIVLLKEVGVKGKGYCPICGNELIEDVITFDDNGFKCTAHKACTTNMVEKIEQVNEEKEMLPNNYLKGFLGACIGALIGCIAFTTLFMIGFISSFVAMLTVYLSQVFYLKMKGKEDTIMICICSGVSLLFTVINYVLLYIFVASTIAVEHGFDSTGISAFSDMMTIGEFQREFTANLGLTIFFTILGIIFQISNIRRKFKLGKVNIKVEEKETNN